jgi:AcrR family transcriptional regulator
MLLGTRLDERAQRIVDTAVSLAERDGFAAVRLRDVAAQAQVALGTVYKRFSSKEEILLAALGGEAERLAERLSVRAGEGTSPAERVQIFFETATEVLLEKPKLTRALVRAMVTAGREVHSRVISFHALTTMMIIAAIRGTRPDEPQQWGGESDAEARQVARLLQHVWFASLVGWSSGIHEEDQVYADIEAAVSRLLP